MTILFGYLSGSEKMPENIDTTGMLSSEKIRVNSFISFKGSAQRIWQLTQVNNQALRVFLQIVSVFAIYFVWCFVAIWYFFFFPISIPYRYFRNNQKRDQIRALQHREQLEMLAAMQHQQTLQTAHLINQTQNSIKE